MVKCACGFEAKSKRQMRKHIEESKVTKVENLINPHRNPNPRVLRFFNPDKYVSGLESVVIQDATEILREKKVKFLIMRYEDLKALREKYGTKIIRQILVGQKHRKHRTDAETRNLRKILTSSERRIVSLAKAALNRNGKFLCFREDIEKIAKESRGKSIEQATYLIPDGIMNLITS